MSSDSSDSSDDDRYQPHHGLTSAMNVFLNSPGFTMLEQNGFLKWGTEEKFLEDFKSGTNGAFETAIEFVKAAEAQEESDSEDSESSTASVSSSSGSNSGAAAIVVPEPKKKSKKKKKKKKQKKKSSSESDSSTPKGDWRIHNGVIVDAAGNRLELGGTESEVTHKKFLKVLNQLTLRKRKSFVSKTADQLIKEKLLGITDDTREYADLWAKKWGSEEAEYVTEFKQPEYLYRGSEPVKNKLSQLYRFPLEIHMQGLVEGLKFTGLSGEVFDENSQKSALARAKKFNSLSLKTSAYEILANRFLAAQTFSTLDGLGKLLHFMQLQFPEDIESKNKKLWDVFGQLRLSILHVGKIHSQVLASISEIEKIQDKSLRLKSEKLKMQELHNHIWRWPLFQDATVDTSYSRPPKFFNKPRPFEVNRWQAACKKDVCGSQKLQSSSKSTSAPKGAPKWAPSKKRKRDGKDKDVPKGQYACRICKKNHQHGQRCPKRKKRNPKPKTGKDSKKGTSD